MKRVTDRAKAQARAPGHLGSGRVAVVLCGPGAALAWGTLKFFETSQSCAARDDFRFRSAIIADAAGQPAAFQATRVTRGSDNVKISVRHAGGRCRADRGGAGDAGAHATATTTATPT